MLRFRFPYYVSGLELQNSYWHIVLVVALDVSVGTGVLKTALW